MKKLFALFAVAALAAVGCDDKGKSTSGGTKTNTIRATELGTATKTHTLVDLTETHRATNTANVTVRVTASGTKTDTKPGGPSIPEPGKKNGKD